ncbi:lysophospholipid acyltransferase family protein [Pseudomonadota bacterium]
MNRQSRCGWNPDRIRRLVLTVFLYIAFGAGALGVSLLLILPIVITSIDRRRRVSRVRLINRLAFNSFTRSGIALGVFDIAFEHDDLLDQPGQLIIANHPTLLDIVFLLGRIPDANCVIKSNLLKNPFLAMPVFFADYIQNVEGEAMLDECISNLERGNSLIIFPEGTRTKQSNSFVFKRGAAYLMLMSNCLVRPVYISCDPPALGKKDHWYMVPERKITYRLSVLDELDLKQIRQNENVKVPLKSRRLTLWLADWYHKMNLEGPKPPLEIIDLARLVNK